MPEARRDRWGRYLVVPPQGGKPVGYTRVTTIAKTADDGGGLIPWKATLAVVGSLRRPGILASWQALIAEHPDPWYSPAKDRCKQLVEQAAEAGGALDRADVGTALHALIEQSSKNGWAELPIVQPEMQADIDAYRRTLDAAGVRVFPEFVERVVVLDDYQAAGTSDNLALEVPGFGLVVGDLKTGADLRYSWQSIAVQLAAYANADAMYTQGDAADGGGDRREPMPPVSKEVGLVIHLPAGEARCELHLVDLVAGWEAFQMSMDIRRWRSRKDLARPLTSQPTQQTPQPTPPTFDTPTATRTGPTPAEQFAQFEPRHHPDEGGDVDDASVEALRSAAGALTSEAKTVVTATVQESIRAGLSLHMSERRTMRRFEVMRGVVTVAELVDDQRDTLRCIAASVIGDIAHYPSVPVGHVLGSMNADEASQFAQLCDQYAAGDVTGHVDETSGHVQLVFAS